MGMVDRNTITHALEHCVQSYQVQSCNFRFVEIVFQTDLFATIDYTALRWFSKQFLSEYHVPEKNLIRAHR